MTGLRLLGVDAGNEGTSMVGRVGLTTTAEKAVALRKKTLVTPNEDVRSCRWTRDDYHRHRTSTTLYLRCLLVPQLHLTVQEWGRSVFLVWTHTQDAIQIVARAALCFDNRTANATASFCSSPCFGEMMLMTSCIDGIMSSFSFYRPGLMQGVQSIFQMACSGGGGNGSSNATVSRVAYGGESPIPMSKFGVQRCDFGGADEEIGTTSTKQFDEQIHLLELVRFTWLQCCIHITSLLLLRSVLLTVQVM
ncbi:hypothetical protein BHE74_00017986 [Ensete ventricosum]|nr:hypothetical protein BHE74_00017986 [Ensete ventricosum]